jgi:hypothetical protein
MITGESLSLLRKAYLRPEGRGLSSTEALGGSSNSSRGLGYTRPSSSSSLGLAQELALLTSFIYKVGFNQIIKICNLNLFHWV